MIDSVFKLIHKDSVDTDILIEKSLVNTAYMDFKGDSINDDTCDYGTLLQLFGALYWGSTDTNQRLPYVTDYDSIAQLYRDSGYVPIGMVFVPYNKTKSNAFTDSLLIVDGIQVRQNSPWRGHPFEEQTMCAASGMTEEHDSSVVNFILPEELVENLTGDMIDYVEADFDDGNGFVPLTMNTVVPIDYESPIGKKVVLFRVFFPGGKVKLLKWEFRFRNRGGYWAWDEPVAIPDEFWYVQPTANHSGGLVSIAYGCGHSKLIKPLIVAEGFDPPQFGNNQHFDRFIKDDIWRLRNELELSGYDIVYVDNFNGADAVERNAALLRAVINRVNDALDENGSTEKNTVVGFSMGGVVARIALKAMENATEDHNTRLYLSFDAPHQGAYGPLSAQFMLYHLYEYKIAGKRIFADVVPQLKSAVNMMKTPAARQMLFYNIYAGATDYADYISALSTLGFPSQCEVKAVANGSQVGLGQQVAPNNFLVTINNATEFFIPVLWANPNSYPYNQKPIKMALGGGAGNFTMRAMPDIFQGTKEIYRGKADIRLFGFLNVFTLTNVKVSMASRVSFENFPAGVYGWEYMGLKQNELPSGTTLHASGFAFVPTGSALHVNTTNPYLNIQNALTLNPSLSPFETDYTAPITTTSMSSTMGLGFNEYHTLITDVNDEWIGEQLFDYVNHSLDDLSNLNQRYNFGKPSSGLQTTDRLRDINIQNNGILCVACDETIGLASEALNQHNANTNFEVHTVSKGCNSVNILVQDGGEIRLGDAGLSNSGTLRLTSGSTIYFNTGSKLTLYKNSQFIIEPGAIVHFSPDVTIDLIDDNSVLVINGALHLESGTTLTFTGDGFLNMDLQAYSGANVFAKDNNCGINLTGADPNDKVLELHSSLDGFTTVTGSLYPLNSFTLQNCKVEMDVYSKIDLFSASTHIENVTFVKTTGATGNYRGVVLRGQDESDVYIRHCSFEDADMAIKRIGSASPTTNVEIGDCSFNNCDVAIYTSGHGLKLKYNKFTDCSRGWQAVDMTSPSEFLGWAEDCSFGIDFTGNADANLFVYSSTFDGCGTGIYSWGDGISAVKCSDFNNNDYGHIYKIYGKLKIDNVQNYTRLNTSTDYAGYNNFGNSSQYSIFLQEVDDFSIEDGYNSFIMNPNPSNYVFDGSLNYGALDISNNYWQMQSGGSTVNYLVSSYFSLVDYSNSNTPVTLTASPNLSSNVIECARWGGETVSDGDWNVFVVKRINPETDKNSIGFLSFEVFPIPADKSLMLISKGNIELDKQARVKVIDITGREIDLTMTEDVGAKTRRYDVSQLAPGVYLLIVEQKGQTIYKKKVVISH